MIMNTKSTNLIIGILTLLSFGIAAWAYPQLPGVIAGHWNAAGQVDGYMPKFWGLLLMPMIVAVLWLLFTVIPNIDPFKANFAAFRRQYNLLVLIIVFVMLIIDKLTLLWNFGYRFPFANAIDALFGLLFIGIGALMPSMKRNFFMGIRTPWTLASEKVWDETHRRGGKVFLVAGVVALLSAFLPAETGTFIAVGTLIVAGVWTVIDSYLIYRRLN
jgi:uncharacterized membrane protein